MKLPIPVTLRLTSFAQCKHFFHSSFDIFLHIALAAISSYYQAMASPEAICGNCVFFDLNSCDGTPVGSVTIEGQKVSQGFCRTNNGLRLMTRSATNSCRQSEGTFKPKSQESVVFEAPQPSQVHIQAPSSPAESPAL